MIKITIELTEAMAQDLIRRERAITKGYHDVLDIDDKFLLEYFIYASLVDRYGKCGSLLDKIDFQHDLSGKITHDFGVGDKV